MKKKFTISAIVFLVITTVFANSSRFYKEGKVIDTMYINSQEGLRVRENPSIKANKLCSVPYRIPVKIIAVGKESTIDGISEPWIEILIPKFLQEKAETKFGWVFGGYLSKDCPQINTTKWTAEVLENYLSSTVWDEYENDETCNYIFRFDKADHRFWRGKEGSGIGEGGTWKAISKNTVEFHTSYVMEEDANDSWSLEFTFRPDGSFYYSGKDENFYCYPSYNDETDPYYATSYKGNYITHFQDLYWSPYNVQTKDEIIQEAIEDGISCEGTKYENEYREYWDPIMKEHQNKVDETK